MSKIENQPPRLALRFFRLYCRADRQEELEGDLEEFYYLRLKRGESIFKANAFYWWNVLRCYRRYSRATTKTRLAMTSLFKSYFKLALRHSWKNKGPVTINVVGLGLALSMCVFVYILHAYNIEFDSFYEDTQDLYRVHAITEQNGEERRNEFSPLALDYALRNDISGIDEVSSYSVRNLKIKRETDFFTENVGIVSADFPEMFDIPLSYGAFESFGELPLVYVTEATATKYFGSEVALGRKLTLYLSDSKKLEATVGGVFEKIPLNTTFSFGLLMSREDYNRTLSVDVNDWSAQRFMGHYLKLTAGQRERITDDINQTVSLQNESNKLLKIRRYELIPFAAPFPSDIVDGASYVNRPIRPEALIIFTTLGLIVFLTACFNLANTSIALIARRLKEIGVRKTLGSGSRQILVQFLMEMGIISAFAFIIAISTANLTSKTIMGLFGAKFLLQDVDLTGVILFVIGFLLFTTLVAGLLPALYAWRFQPVAIMRKSVRLKGVNFLNKALTVSQYSFTIMVLITGITFWQNSNFLDELDLGYTTEGVINLPVDNRYFEELRQEIDRIPGVVTAGAANHIGDFGRYSSKVQFQTLSDTTAHPVRFHGVGDKYLDVMEVKLNAGRGFLEGGRSDHDKILVSQSLVDEFFEGRDVVNEVVKINGERKTIIGVTIDIIDDVVKAAQLLPTVMALSGNEEQEHLVVKVRGRDINEVEDQLKSIWRKYVDEPYAGVHQRDFAFGVLGNDSKNLQKIFLAMAVLSGFLSIVGIFSLAQINVARRIKEISIRKVLGASFEELLLTVNRSFTLMLLTALVLGSALGYLISDQVLGLIYKYHAEASISLSLLSGAFVVLLSIFIISNVVRAPANSNLVHGLRDE